MPVNKDDYKRIKDHFKHLFKSFYEDKNLLNRIVDSFLMFEFVNTVRVRYYQNLQIDDLSLLFSKTMKVGAEEDKCLYITDQLHLLFPAGINHYSIKRAEEDYFKNDKLEEYRLFRKEGKKIIRKDPASLTDFRNREDEYLYALEKAFEEIKKPKIAEVGKEYSYSVVRNQEPFQDKTKSVQFDPVTGIASKKPKLNSSKRLDSITISLNELKDAADKICIQDEEKTYFRKVLQELVLKEFDKNQLNDTDTIEIKHICNIVGMVGLGKSTLIEIFIYILRNRGLKILLVKDTVMNCFKDLKSYMKLGLSAVPLLGRSNALKHYARLSKEDKQGIDQQLAKYFESPCLIEGMDFGHEVDSVSFHAEGLRYPCFSLKDKHTNNTVQCPYFDFCPAASLYREVLESPFVITTVEAMMTVTPKSAYSFLEHTLNTFDLVIFDEADQAMQSADRISSQISYFTEDFIKPLGFYIQRKGDRLHLEDQTMLNAIRSFENIQPLIVNAYERLVTKVIKSPEDYQEWKGIENQVLYLNLVLENIRYFCRRNYSISPEKELNPICEKLIQELRSFITYQKNGQCEIWENIARDDLVFDKDQSKQALKYEIHERLIVIGFTDSKYQKLNVLEEYIVFLLCLRTVFYWIRQACEGDSGDLIGARAKNIASNSRMRNSTMAKYLIHPFRGSNFGIQIVDSKQKNNNGKDILLYSQAAVGRSAVLNLSSLKLSKTGQFLGPHTLLFSGSSFLPGSLEYHVPVPVDYVMVTPQEKKDFIKEIDFYIYQGLELVSGHHSKPSEKMRAIQENLERAVLKQILRDIRENRKCLLIVNSYDQAEATAKIIESLLSKQGLNHKISYLVKEKEQLDEYQEEVSVISISRREIQDVNLTDAKILIAPAKAIERGYNLLDEKGHSYFSSLYFLVRPMSGPADLQSISAKINGAVYASAENNHFDIPWDRAKFYKKKANEFWFREYRLNFVKYFKDITDIELKNDILLETFVSVLQIIGRLLRIADYQTVNKPKIYFCDGAFSYKGVNGKEMSFLESMQDCLENILNDENTGIIAENLYGTLVNQLFI